MLSYQRETFRRETVVRASPSARIDEHGLTFLVHLEPGQEWITELQVTPMILRRGRPQPLVAGWRDCAGARSDGPSKTPKQTSGTRRPCGNRGTSFGSSR